MEARPGIVVSGTVHVLAIAWAIFGITAAKPFDTASSEPLPIEIVTPSQFDHLTKGTRTGKDLNANKLEAKKMAPAMPEPKPDLPEAKEDVTPPPPAPAPPQPEVAKPAPPEAAKPVPPKPKAAEPPKPVPVPPPPAPAPKPKKLAAVEPDTKPPEKPDVKPVKPEPKVDKREMAELDKLIDAQTPPKPAPKVDRRQKAELDKLISAQAKTAPPTKNIAQFDPTKIAALIDRRDPGHTATAAPQASATSSAGVTHGLDGKLSLSQRSMIDGLVRSQVEQCWSPPAGAVGAQDLQVRVRFSLNADGSLSGTPQVVNTSSVPYFQVAADSAARAVMRCAPLKLPVQFYDYWRDVQITFDPRDMMGG